MAQIFISYGHIDRVFARQLYNSLMDEGFNVWLDVVNIAPSSDWLKTVYEGLSNSQLQLLILSPEALETQTLKDEWKFFYSKERPIIPILLRPVEELPLQLNRLKPVRFYDHSYEQALSSLLKTLRRYVDSLMTDKTAMLTDEFPAVDAEADSAAAHESADTNDHTTNSADRPLLLELAENFQPLRYWAVEADSMTIGRGERSDCVIESRLLSRQHARVFRDGNSYYVEDLDSKNGTWINSERVIKPRPLRDGDEISLAMTVRLRFVRSGVSVPLTIDDAEGMDGVLRVDFQNHEVFVRDQPLEPPLTIMEFSLLALLYNHAGRICPRQEIIDTLWDEEDRAYITEQSVTLLVQKLRQRLADADMDHAYIVRVGTGYRLNNPQR